MDHLVSPDGGHPGRRQYIISANRFEVEKAQAEPDFAAALQKRIDEIGPQLTIFAHLKDSKNVVQLDGGQMRSGKVSVTADADNVDGLTRVRVKTIG